VPEPTTTEWVLVSLAAVLVVVVGGLLLIRPALRPSVTTESRLAGFLIAATAAAVLLVAFVVGAAGWQASRLDPAAGGDDRPTGPFVQYLIDSNPDTTERAAAYGMGVLLPLAAVLVVLALAAVDPARSIGLRVVQGLVCAAILVISLFVAIGDTGPLATRAALGMALLSAGALAALATDELRHRRPEPDEAATPA
jgi:hypothetical protein